MENLFKLHSPFKPAGSQPKAIKELRKARPGKSTLLGVTGSGKTFTLANVIAQHNKPVLILSPNKTLAAQLYEEFSLFFPKNKVCYFVSYYDYYQPESYLPAQDIYIPKESKVNSEIERLRIEASASLVNRPDTIVIASVSAIYSLGNPTDYRKLTVPLHIGQHITHADLLNTLVFIQYKRSDIERISGTFSVSGNTIDIILPYQKEKLRIKLAEDHIEALQWIDKHNNAVLMNLDNTLIFPAKHFVTTQEKKEAAIASIRQEVATWAPQLPNELYQERIRQRVAHDIEMLQEIGFCSGIENYSIHFDNRLPGSTPYCLFDFFPKDFLLIIDESHIAIPQLRAMYAGDKARKQALIEFGFRLPSARDNRPLKFDEIEQHFNDVIFVSATPGAYELEHADHIVEQIIRPTGLLDPEIELYPRTNQLDHLCAQIKETTTKGFRSLVMVLTKKLAEELAHYLEERKIKVCYLHSEIKTPERSELLQKLRAGVFDCLVGVNLLREGIDLPEVALVAIMDGDIEGFLRDKRSLIQIIGRAARNTESRVVIYADKLTKSLENTIKETKRRKTLQHKHNKKHNVIPMSVQREVTKSISNFQAAIALASKNKKTSKKLPQTEQQAVQRIQELEAAMQKAGKEFNFDKAIALRQEWSDLKKMMENNSK